VLHVESLDRYVTSIVKDETCSWLGHLSERLYVHLSRVVLSPEPGSSAIGLEVCLILLATEVDEPIRHSWWMPWDRPFVEEAFRSDVRDALERLDELSQSRVAERG
jgi:hypothetical protein